MIWPRICHSQPHAPVLGCIRRHTFSGFGFWTARARLNGGAGAASLPQTVDSNKRVAARIPAALSGPERHPTAAARQ
jgi:hypothetical protein